jgi:acetyl-CoA acetyltransferase
VPLRIMSIGTGRSSKRVLAGAGLSFCDIGVIEINEAFAAQVLACLRVNTNGGAIAVGHTGRHGSAERTDAVNGLQNGSR